MKVLINGYLASASSDHTIKIWNVDTEEVLQTLSGHSGWIYNLVVFKNGNLASSSADKTFKIWDTNNGS